MALKLRYGLYNVGQYPEKLDEAQALADEGWRPLAIQLNYNEVYILWGLETTDAQAKEEPAPEQEQVVTG